MGPVLVGSPKFRNVQRGENFVMLASGPDPCWLRLMWFVSFQQMEGNTPKDDLAARTPSCKENMADVAKEAGKRMEYPYTYTAKFLNFPWKLYFTKQWLWKTLPFALLVTSPMFYKISKASNSPENVAKWKEIRRKEHEHHDD